MIFVAYAFLIVAVLAYFHEATSPVPPRFEIPARVLGTFAAIGFAAVALLLLGEAPPLGGTVLLLLLAVGAGVYLWGLARWHHADGFALRRTGWFSILAALAFPTTLTLLMPVAYLLVLTLRSTVEPRPRFARLSPPVRR